MKRRVDWSGVAVVAIEVVFVLGCSAVLAWSCERKADCEKMSCSAGTMPRIVLGDCICVEMARRKDGP